MVPFRRYRSSPVNNSFYIPGVYILFLSFETGSQKRVEERIDDSVTDPNIHSCIGETYLGVGLFSCLIDIEFNGCLRLVIHDRLRSLISTLMWFTSLILPLIP